MALYYNIHCVKTYNCVKIDERATIKLTQCQKMLVKELETALASLFYVTPLFQRSQVSSSAVVPCITNLKEELRDEKNIHLLLYLYKVIHCIIHLTKHFA